MSDELRTLFQELIRRFGLLSADTTPCGKPLASSDAHALMLLLEAGEDGLRSSTLATRLGIDKSTASRVVTRLIASGHITTAPSAEDGRAKPIWLTSKGRRMATEVSAASRDRFATLLEHVPPRRRAGVVCALGELVAALEKMTSDHGKPTS